MREWPLGQKFEDGEQYTPDSGIRIKQWWPEPEIRGHGIVRTKDGVIKEDGCHTKQRSG